MSPNSPVGLTPEQVADVIIKASQVAAMAVRMVRLRLPAARIVIEQKEVRGCMRDVMTVTMPTEDAGTHGELGDLIYDLAQEPCCLDVHRNGPRQVKVKL